MRKGKKDDVNTVYGFWTGNASYTHVLITLRKVFQTTFVNTLPILSIETANFPSEKVTVVALPLLSRSLPNL